MLLSGYTKNIFRPECNPTFESVHCITQLNEDVGEVLPYPFAFAAAQPCVVMWLEVTNKKGEKYD